jgi:putative NIF3 family GTP cyclohydrolase 1 type 2
MKWLMSLVASMVIAVGILIAPPALAHGGHDHIMGVVTAVDATSVTVQNAEKAIVKVILDDHTKYEKDGKPASLKDVAVGQRAVIHAEKGEGGKGPVAETVKVSST